MMIMDYINILRPKNLLLVAVSQVLIYVLYLYSILEKRITLDSELWILFILDTVIIAGSGYVINDIFDAKADMHNKIGKTYIGVNKISIRNAIIYYSILVLLGLGIAWYIAFHIDKIHLLFIYPIAVALLFLYSYIWKGSVLFGNVIVSIFCAFVPGIVLFAEIDNVILLRTQDPSVYRYYSFIFLGYISFAFFSTMVREIIKDIEDQEGDRIAGYHTLPIVYGEGVARLVAICMGVLLLLSYGFWVYPMIDNSLLAMSLVFLLLVFPTIVVLYKIARAKSILDYSQISSLIKMIMIVSLIVFLCIPFL